MSSHSNSAGLSMLRPKFRKKSHSKRRKIFVERTAKKTLPLLREVHDAYGIEVTESELEKMARDYSRSLAHQIWDQRRVIFSNEPAEKRDFEGLVNDIVSKVQN